MILTLIAAIGKNNELGKGNDLVWKIPADLKHFKEMTSGHPIIMGRKTFESLGVSPSGELGRALPNRKNIVITRDKTYLRHGVDVVHSLDEALALCGSPTSADEEIFIIGGSEIFRQAMEGGFATRLDITRIEAEDKDADVFFPPISPGWKEKSREDHPADEKYPAYSFLIYEK